MNHKDSAGQAPPNEAPVQGECAEVTRASPEPLRDQLFAEQLSERGLFSFNEAVASVFPDMINRSVPGYKTVVSMTGVLAARHARPNANIYDLGCSWGASLLSVAKEPACQSCQLIGIDNSEAMLSACSRRRLRVASASAARVRSVASAAFADASAAFALLHLIILLGSCLLHARQHASRLQRGLVCGGSALNVAVHLLLGGVCWSPAISAMVHAHLATLPVVRLFGSQVVANALAP